MYTTLQRLERDGLVESDAGDDGSGRGVYAQQYRADGTPRGGEIARSTVRVCAMPLVVLRKVIVSL